MSLVNARLQFFRSPRHQCGYFAERQAETVFAHPNSTPDMATQTVLARHGFRRSGKYIYRPACTGCRACVPVRVVVPQFKPSRSQRRVSRRNRDLQMKICEAHYDDEILDLYRRYQASRHPGGEMMAFDAGEIATYFAAQWSKSRFFEYRLHDNLVCVAIADRLEDAWSAVYTFFDPDHARRSLGTQAILSLINAAAEQGLPWVYLGYWIAESPKMNYKNRFRPLQRFADGKWLPLES